MQFGETTSSQFLNPNGPSLQAVQQTVQGEYMMSALLRKFQEICNEVLGFLTYKFLHVLMFSVFVFLNVCNCFNTYCDCILCIPVYFQKSDLSSSLSLSKLNGFEKVLQTGVNDHSRSTRSSSTSCSLLQGAMSFLTSQHLLYLSTVTEVFVWISVSQNLTLLFLSSEYLQHLALWLVHNMFSKISWQWQRVQHFIVKI